MAKKKITLSPAEHAKQQLQYTLKRIEETLDFIPPPTYSFQIGDPVEIGCLTNVVVLESHFGGKAYLIDYSSTDCNYGNPIATYHSKMIVKWVDIRKPTDNKQSFIKNDDMRLSYSSSMLGELFGKAYYFGCDMDPVYQRDYVWDLPDKVALIDSIFNNIDIGKFLFNQLSWDKKYTYEIIDGKQRMRAILDFFEDRYEYKGCTFSQLGHRDQNHFEGYMTNIATIKQATPEQVLRYFLMVNKTGRVMDKAHLDKVEEMLENERNEL